MKPEARDRERVRASVRAAAAADDLITEFLGATLALAAVAALVAAGTVLAAAHPSARSLAVACLLGASLVGLFKCRRRLVGALRARPAILRAAAVVPAVVLVADGGLDCPDLSSAHLVVACIALLGFPGTALSAAALLTATGSLALLSDGPLRPDGWSDAEVVRWLVGTGVTAALVAAAFGLPVVVFTRLLSNLDRAILKRRPAGSIEAGAPVRQLTRPMPPVLTPAERRILDLLAQGLPPKVIAAQLGLSLHTVRTHLKRAKRKRDARTLEELVAALHRPREIR